MIKISINNLSRQFGDIIALNACSLSFEPGMIHGIIGPEGAGKTTLIRTLLGLLDCKSGQILYEKDGRQVSLQMVRDYVAYMPEKQNLYGDLSIKEHMLFFKDLYGMSDEVYQEKSKMLLQLTRLDKFQDRTAKNLSGGMYKKLGLICALLRSPEIVLLDEPTNGVDPISRREFWSLLYGLTMSQNITVIMATAYMDEAERCAKVHLLEHGHVIACGEPQQLMKRYQVKSFDELFLKKREEYGFNC